MDVAFTVETGKTTEQIEAEKKEEEKKKLSETVVQSAVRHPM